MANQQINVNLSGNSVSLVSAVNKGVSSLKGLNTTINAVNKSLGALSVNGAKATGQFTKLSAVLPIKGIGALGGAFKNLSSWINNHNKTLAQSATYYKGLVGQVSNLNRFINVLGSSVRQIGQGLQNFGTSFTLYVSAPVSAFIYSMTKGFIDFQDQMIEVRRTTGLTMSDIGDLQKEIQKISLTTPTSPEDLASITADWGRLGITRIDVLSKLTEEADKFMISTSLVKDQVVNDLGKIGSLYFETEGELADNYARVASAINELGQASPVSESDIIGAFLRAAPVGQLLDISLPDMLGLATTVAERAASPERAGSQLSRALTEQASKVQLFADALGVAKEEVIKMIDTDAVGFFMNMLDVISKLDSKTKQVQIAEALFGGVGGKATNALAANLEGLYDNIVLANEAYDDGTSIQKEYLRATDSVKVQLGILQNNFKFLGYTIAEQVIPYVTKFAAMAIPALRSITEAFTALSERNKFLIVGLGLLMAVIGPLTIFLGSFLFSIGIITTGMTALFTQVIGVGVGLGKFIFSILALLQPIGLLVTAIIAIGSAFVYITGAASTAGNMLAGYIMQFVTWGYNLMGGFAQGIADGASLVYDVVLAVINGFVGLIQAFSPPKEGPLKGVEIWGTGLIDSYSDGIEKGAPRVREGFLKAIGVIPREAEAIERVLGALSKDAGETVSGGVAEGVETNMPAVNRVLDALKKKVDETNDYIITVGAKFSESFASGLKNLSVTGVDLFSNIFNEVRGVVEAVANNLGLEKEDTDKRILKAADAVRQLIAAFESGGDLGSLESLYSVMGGLGDEADDLVKSQIEYNNATKELDRIKKQAGDADESLRKEIAAIAARTDLSMNQKTALIRNARFRNSTRKEDLKSEQEAAEDRVDTLKDELKRKEQILNTLTGLMFPAQKEQKKKAKEDDVTGALPGFDVDAYKDGLKKAQDETKKLFDEAGDELGTFFGKIDKAQKMWEGFVNGITGGPLPSGMVGQDFWDGWIPGNDIREKWLKLQDGIASIGTTLDNIRTKAENLLKIFLAGTLAGYLGIDRSFLSNWGIFEKIISTIGWGLGIAVAEVETLFRLLKSPTMKIWDEIKTTDTYARASAAVTGNSFFTEFIRYLDFATLGRNLADGFNIVIDRYFNPTGDFYMSFSDNIKAILGGIIEFTASFFATADLKTLALGLAGIVNTVIGAFGPENLDSKNVTTAVTNVLNSILYGLSHVSIEDRFGNNIFSNLLGAIINGLIAVDTKPFISNLGTLVSNLVEALADVPWVDLGTALSDIINNLLTALGSKELWTNLGEAFGGLVAGVITTITGIDWGITADIFGGLVTGVQTAIKEAFTWENVGTWGADLGVAILDLFYRLIIGNFTGTKLQDGGPGVGLQVVPSENYDEVQKERKNSSNWNPMNWLPNMLNSWSTPGADSGANWTSGLGDWMPWSYGNMMQDGDIGPDTLAPHQTAVEMGSIMPGWGESSGTQASKDYAAAVDTGLRSPETITMLTNAIAALTADSSAASAIEVEKVGAEMGGVMMTGLVNRVSGETAVQELDEHWLTGLSSWVTSRETELDGVGMDVGNKTIHGFLAETNDAQGYMGQWSTTMKKWIAIKANADKFGDTGISIGVEIVKGIADVLSEAGPTLASIAEAGQALTPMSKAVRDQTIDSIGERLRKPPEEEPTVEKSSISLARLPSYVDTTQNNSGVQIQISIAGGIPSEQAQMKKMADMIYDKMRKEGKIKGVNI